MAIEVSILLSTYNGAAHLARQLASLYSQSWPGARIFVRDDGSSDGTPLILAEEQAAGRLVAEVGANIGSRDSFFELLEQAGEADVVLLCDQDDVWYQDKVARAVQALGELPVAAPGLYCARVDIVDARLARIGRSPRWPRAPSFGNALVENIAMGCTIALNRPARDLLRSVHWPRAAIMHDWWCYLVVSALGSVIYDPQPVLAYRLHGANTVGLPTGRLQSVLAKAKRQLRSPALPRLIAQAREFRELYGEALASDHHPLIEALVGSGTLAGRIGFLMEGGIKRQFAVDDLALKTLVMVRGSA